MLVRALDHPLPGHPCALSLSTFHPVDKPQRWIHSAKRALSQVPEANACTLTFTQDLPQRACTLKFTYHLQRRATARSPCTFMSHLTCIHASGVSACRFWFYGDDPIDERLRRMAEYLDQYEPRTDIESLVPPQPLFTAPKQVVGYYAAGADAEVRALPVSPCYVTCSPRFVNSSRHVSADEAWSSASPLSCDQCSAVVCASRAAHLEVEAACELQ